VLGRKGARHDRQQPRWKSADMQLARRGARAL
jgi:hypothetical protein